jgi:hypothetical protein
VDLGARPRLQVTRAVLGRLLLALVEEEHAVAAPPTATANTADPSAEALAWLAVYLESQHEARASPMPASCT